MRIGLLGTGRMAAIHARSLRRHADVEIVVGRGNPDRAGEAMRSTWDSFAARLAEAYDAEIDGFIALCSGAGDNEAPARAAVDALAIAELRERSARNRTRVVIEKGAAE